MTNRISIAILLRSGVDAGGFHARVIEGGGFVEVVVKWPAGLVNPELLHKKWLISNDDDDRLEPYHPKIFGFQTALKALRKLGSDNMESSVRIPLPFAVQTHIPEKCNLAWKESFAKIVYLGLQAVDDAYSVVKDSQAFEAV